MPITVRTRRNGLPLLGARVRSNNVEVSRSAAALVLSLAVGFAPARSGALKGTGKIIQRGSAFTVQFGGSGVGYAEYVEAGTGIYGPTHAPITPKNGNYLVFEINGKTIFARSVKGMRAQPYLAPAVAIVEPKFLLNCQRNVVSYR